MKLTDVCEFIVDCPHSTALDEGRGYPLIRTPNIGKGRLLLENVHRVSEKVYQERIQRGQPQDGDLIFAREAPAGNVAIIKNGEKVCLGQRTVLIRPNKDKVNSTFLAYYLLAPKQQNGLLGSANGSTVPHVNLPTIRNLEISLPSLEKQVTTASIIESYDDLIENNQKQIKLLEEAAQRLYKEWFVDLRFPGWENTKIVDGVPERWEKLPLSSFADIVMGQSPKSEFYNTTHDGIPFHQGVGSYGKRFVVDNIFSNSYARIAEAGSILFSVRAPVGRLNITKNKIAIGRGLAALNHKKGYQSFLFYLLKDRFFKDDLLGNGSIFASISKNELYNQVFIVPNNFLANQFNIIVSNIDRKISIIDEQLNRLVKTRDRLLSKLMNAEMEV